MKYLVLLFAVILFAGCGNDATESSTPADSISTDSMTAKQLDSLQKSKEEEEQGAEIIEGVLMR